MKYTQIVTASHKNMFIIDEVHLSTQGNRQFLPALQGKLERLTYYIGPLWGINIMAFIIFFSCI
jgi:hypothetical protein